MSGTYSPSGGTNTTGRSSPAFFVSQASHHVSSHRVVEPRDRSSEYVEALEDLSSLDTAVYYRSTRSTLDETSSGHRDGPSRLKLQSLQRTATSPHKTTSPPSLMQATEPPFRDLPASMADPALNVASSVPSAAAAPHFRCYNCHELGHVSQYCPLPKMVICYNCHREGHKTYECVEGKRCHRCRLAGHLIRDCKAHSTPFTPRESFLAPKERLQSLQTATEGPPRRASLDLRSTTETSIPWIAASRSKGSPSDCNSPSFGEQVDAADVRSAESSSGSGASTGPANSDSTHRHVETLSLLPPICGSQDGSYMQAADSMTRKGGEELPGGEQMPLAAPALLGPRGADTNAAGLERAEGALFLHGPRQGVIDLGLASRLRHPSGAMERSSDQQRRALAVPSFDDGGLFIRSTSPKSHQLQPLLWSHDSSRRVGAFSTPSVRALSGRGEIPAHAKFGHYTGMNPSVKPTEGASNRSIYSKRDSNSTTAGGATTAASMQTVMSSAFPALSAREAGSPPTSVTSSPPLTLGGVIKPKGQGSLDAASLASFSKSVSSEMYECAVPAEGALVYCSPLELGAYCSLSNPLDGDRHQRLPSASLCGGSTRGGGGGEKLAAGHQRNASWGGKKEAARRSFLSQATRNALICQLPHDTASLWKSNHGFGESEIAPPGRIPAGLCSRDLGDQRSAQAVLSRIYSEIGQAESPRVAPAQSSCSLTDPPSILADTSLVVQDLQDTASFSLRADPFRLFREELTRETPPATQQMSQSLRETADKDELKGRPATVGIEATIAHEHSRCDDQSQRISAP